MSQPIETKVALDEAINPEAVKHQLGIDWLELKQGLIALSISFVISIVIVLSCQQYHSYWVREHDRQKALLKTVESTYNEVSSASEVVRFGYLEIFQKLVAEGFFKEKSVLTSRGELLAATEQLNDFFPAYFAQLGISEKNNLGWTFLGDDRTLLNVEQLSFTPDFKVYSTPLKIEVHLLHDEDVLDFIKNIENLNLEKPIGLLKLQSCDIQRLRETNVEDVSQPYLLLNCILTWYSSRVEQQ